MKKWGIIRREKEDWGARPCIQAMAQPCGRRHLLCASSPARGEPATLAVIESCVWVDSSSDGRRTALVELRGKCTTPPAPDTRRHPITAQILPTDSYDRRRSVRLYG